VVITILRERIDLENTAVRITENDILAVGLHV